MSRQSQVALVLTLFVVVGLLWVRTIPPRTPEPPTEVGTLTDVWVIDGDTFDGTGADGQKLRVRILGIDAPEVAHPPTPAGCGGEEAKQALVALLGGRSVTVAVDPSASLTDQYGRTLAYVSAPGIPDVGLRLLDDGLVEAWHPASDRAPQRFASYVAAQAAARTAGTGSWSACGTLGR